MAVDLTRSGRPPAVRRQERSKPKKTTPPRQSRSRSPSGRGVDLRPVPRPAGSYKGTDKGQSKGSKGKSKDSAGGKGANKGKSAKSKGSEGDPKGNKGQSKGKGSQGDPKGNKGQPRGQNSQGKSKKGLTLGATARRNRGKLSGKAAINKGPSYMQVAVACPKRASVSREVHRLRTLSTLRSARKERR